MLKGRPVNGDFDEAAYDFVRQHEGFQPITTPDPLGIPTIGVGTALLIDTGTNNVHRYVVRRRNRL